MNRHRNTDGAAALFTILLFAIGLGATFGVGGLAIWFLWGLIAPPAPSFATCGLAAVAVSVIAGFFRGSK